MRFIQYTDMEIQGRCKLNGNRYFLYTIYHYSCIKPFQRPSRQDTGITLQCMRFVQD